LLRNEAGDAKDLIDEILKGKHRILCAGQPAPLSGLPDDVHGSAFRTAAVYALVVEAAKAFDTNKAAIMAGAFKSELLAAAAPVKGLMALLKKRIGRKYIYSTPPTLKLEIMGRKVIQDLLDLFWEGVEELPPDGDPSPREFAGKFGALLSPSYRRVFQHFVKTRPDLPERYHRFQLLTDYVSGMTDSFATRLHAELTNG
jgi:dGTPase